MPLYRSASILSGIGLLSLLLCVQSGSSFAIGSENTPSKTSTVTPMEGGRFFIYPLTCPANLSVKEGLSWRGITIGKSSLAELDEVYGVIASPVQPLDKGDFAPIYSITLTGDASRERSLASSMEACVVGGRVTVLALSGDNDKFATPTVQYWIEQYGIPTIITWSQLDWSHRTLVWPKVGLALEVSLGDRVVDLRANPYEIYAETIVFFPPISSEQDLSGWPYSGLRQEALTTTNDGGYPTVKDPFNFENLFGTEVTTLAATVSP